MERKWFAYCTPGHPQRSEGLPSTNIHKSGQNVMTPYPPLLVDVLKEWTLVWNLIKKLMAFFIFSQSHFLCFGK